MNRELKKWLKRVAVAVVVVFAVMWLTWPWVGSKLTMLVPVEKELHSYQKKAMPVENNLLLAYRNLEQDPSDRDQVDEILKQSEQLLAINQEYWVDGKGQPFFQRTMYTLRGMEQPEDYLPNWPGPEDPEGQAMLADMRSDTATLAVQSWTMMESGNTLASTMIATFGDGAPVTQGQLEATAPVVKEARAARENAEFVYKRWKGNYRPPLSIFR
jgi:hypothetical protein